MENSGIHLHRYTSHRAEMCGSLFSPCGSRDPAYTLLFPPPSCVFVKPPAQAPSVPAAPVTAATASTSRPRARDVAHPPPPPRPSVIFGEDLPHDHAWAPGTRANDYLEKDRKLGYQIPRLWFPQTLAGGIGRENGRGDPRRNGLCVPDPRPPPLQSVAHPPSVARLEAEHHQLLSYHNYCALHELVKKGKSGARRAAGVERSTWAELVARFKRNADLDSFKHEWTPRCVERERER